MRRRLRRGRDGESDTAGPLSGLALPEPVLAASDVGPVVVVTGDDDVGIGGGATVERLERILSGVADVVHLTGGGTHSIVLHLLSGRRVLGSLAGPFDDVTVLDWCTRTGGAGGDVYQTAAMALSRTEDPVAAIAVVIAHLIRSRRVAVADLDRIGITPDVVQSIVDGFERNDNLVALGDDLSVIAAVRGFRQQLDAVAVEAGIAPGTAAFDGLQLAVVSYAKDEGIDDLTVAYRLWRAREDRSGSVG